MPRPQSTFYHDVYVNDTVITTTDSIVFDTVVNIDTIPTLVDTVVTVEYYISATSNNGKTVTKPMTAHQGGYYSYYYTGQLDTVSTGRNYD